MRELLPKWIPALMLALVLSLPANAKFSLYVDGVDEGAETSIMPGDKIWIGIHNDVENQFQYQFLVVLNLPASASWTGRDNVYIPPNVPGARNWFYPPDLWASGGSGVPNEFYGVGVLSDFELQCDGEGDSVVELLNAADLSVFDRLTIHQIIPEPIEADLGDAPDSSNNFGVTMTAYTATGVQANYPTVFNDGNSAGPFGPMHKYPLAVAYLGDGVTLEEEADIGWDQDLTNNIMPDSNTADLDSGDDGVLDMPLFLPHCKLTTFHYLVNVIDPNFYIFINVWFDWNRDGDWDDTLQCDVNTVDEWAVQNLIFITSNAGIYPVSTIPFLSWHPGGGMEEEPIWMRITLSTQAWTGSGAGGITGRAGSGPAGGYEFGETEDYYFIPETGCFPTCHPDYQQWLDMGELHGMEPGQGPECWCNPRQCHGDAANDLTGNMFTGYTYVGPTDLAILARAWDVKECVNPNGPCIPEMGIKWIPDGICADFAHDKTGSQFTGYTYVGPTDLAIFGTYWDVKEPNDGNPWPGGPGVPADCLDCP